MMKCQEPGWRRIGRIDSTLRRSLWIREPVSAELGEDAIELCAGREGDDAYVRLTRENPQWRELHTLLSCARFAAEWEDDDGCTLEREAVARGEITAEELGLFIKSKDGDYDAERAQELVNEARFPFRDTPDAELIRALTTQLDAAAAVIRRLKGHKCG